MGPRRNSISPIQFSASRPIVSQVAITTLPDADVSVGGSGRRPRRPSKPRGRSWVVGGIVFTIVLGSTALGGGAPKTQSSNADVRAVVAFVGDSNISFGGQSPVADLTYGTDVNVYPGRTLQPNSP